MTGATGATGDSSGMMSFFSNLMSKLGGATEGKGDQMAMIADTLGQRMAPDNIFGGIGTALTKSKMAGEKLAEDEVGLESMLQRIIQDIGSSSDMNKVGIVRDPTTGEVKIDTQTKVAKRMDELPAMKEKSGSTSDFTGQTPQTGSAKTGSMSDLVKDIMGE